MINKRGNKFLHLPAHAWSDKRGQGLSVNAIILIVLGVLVLVILIAGFLTGWKPVKNLINPTNVDSIVESCQTACSLNQRYSFCSAQRVLRVNEENIEVKTSCSVFADVSDFSKHKIQQCPSIECDLSCGDIIIDGKKGSIATEGKYDVSALASDLQEGQKCFIN